MGDTTMNTNYFFVQQKRDETLTLQELLGTYYVMNGKRCFKFFLPLVDFVTRSLDTRIISNVRIEGTNVYLSIQQFCDVILEKCDEIVYDKSHNML
jgi:hypothetical protein